MESEEVKDLLSSINDLIDIKILIREIVPDYKLDESQKKKFLNLLNLIYAKLNPLFQKYLLIQTEFNQQVTTQSIKERLLSILNENTLALVSANSTKKKFKNIGIDPRIIIASGGPLFIEDYKEINPNLTENALQGLKKKCMRLIDQLKKEDWTKKKLYFIYDVNNATDKKILSRLNEISMTVGTSIDTIKIENWNDLEI